MRQPHSYLAFHVEPIDLPLAGIYAFRPDPATLLWLQAVVLALGALPTAWLGRRVLGSWIGGLALGTAWLLAPGLEGAALSDFHAVTIGATLLMPGLWLWETDRRRWAVVALLCAAATREDAALAVAWLGIVLLVRHSLSRWERAGVRAQLRADSPSFARMRAMELGPHPAFGHPLPPGEGLVVALVSISWAALCFLVIAPYFNGGGSLFASRYAWLRHDPGSVPLADIAAYLGTQLLTGGVVCLLAPFQLLAAAPLLLVNSLSSFDWMRSGGAHYSVLLVPPLLWSAAHGARRLETWLPREFRGLPLGLVLGGALAAQLWIGTTTVPDADPAAPAALAELAAIPPDAPLSASSALYPHLAERHRLYWFPAVQDAEWIALDVAAATHPLIAPEMKSSADVLLASPSWGLVDARDGLLLFRRGAQHQPLPDAFFGFARGGPNGDARARFGGSVELVGARLHRWPQVGLFGDAGVLETFWRTTAPVGDDLRFALATTRRSDGALVGLEPDVAPEPIWYPTSRWRPGEVVRMRMPVDRLGPLQAVGVAVLDPRGARLPVGGPADLVAWEGGTIARVTSVSDGR